MTMVGFGLDRKEFQFCCTVTALIFLLCTTTGATQKETYQDRIDVAKKGSEIGPRKGNIVAVPIPVINPTIGNGLQAALIYLHPKRTGDTKSPNATSGLVGMYTDTHSWLTGIFHDDYWAEDKYRFTGFIGYGDLNLEYFGIGDDPQFSDNPIDYEISGLVFMPQFQVRIPKTENWFVGGSYLYINSEIFFKTDRVNIDLPDISSEIESAGAGLLITYDSRDDNYYPLSGQMFRTRWVDYGQTWGGDYEYDKWTTSINHYQPIGGKTVIGLRANLQTSGGDVPFFDLPYLDMRGFPRGRYRDKNTLSLHAEARYKFHQRWGVVAFLEAGWFAEDIEEMTSSKTITTAGGGIRWQVLKEKKLHLGLDVGFSRDGPAVYVHIGEAF